MVVFSNPGGLSASSAGGIGYFHEVWAGKYPVGGTPSADRIRGPRAKWIAVLPMSDQGFLRAIRRKDEGVHGPVPVAGWNDDGEAQATHF